MKKYALVGASSRCLEMYAKPLVKEYGDVAQVVGVFDVNRGRSEYYNRHLGIPIFDDFDTMVKDAKPDYVIVTTVDGFHHQYIIRAMELGCDVISEKPLTTDEAKCNAILETQKRTGKNVTVTFNARYGPYTAKIKELLMDGAIGDILSVNCEYFLDTDHGADYFRRWHGQLENSGGLLVHKSTHHFDWINWWVGDEPDTVFANGGLDFYGAKRANRGERCSNCKFADSCEFYVDYKNDPFMKEFYFDEEKHDGYHRDGCVFADRINIYDNMSVAVKYKKGALLTYSLTAFNPIEGWKTVIFGTKGRLEASESFSGIPALDPHNGVKTVKVYNMKNELATYHVPTLQGGHGGSDERLQRHLFRGVAHDPLGQAAKLSDGVNSLMIGVCANKSIKDGRAHRISDYVTM